MPDSSQHYPLRLTQAQRKVVSEVMPDLTERLNLDELDQRTIPFTLAELKVIQKKATDGILEVSGGMKRNSFRHVADLAFQALDRFQGIGSIPVAERLYQFKVTLEGVEPPIWRRFQVRDCTLDKLHQHLQTAMGWTNSHLHYFKIEGKEYGDQDLLGDDFAAELEDSINTKISAILPKIEKPFPFAYEYDFGDGWRHEVLFEGCVRAERGGRYPLCLEGARACPPEDVGGIPGYEEYLEAMADPNDDRHEEFMCWRGPFDPEAFDASKVTRRMRRGLPDWRLRSWQ